MRRSFRTPTHVVLWAGVLVAVVGVLLVLAAPTSSYGSFGYASSSSEPTNYAYVVGVRPWQLVAGPAFVLIGAVAAAFAGGRLSVRRR